MALYDVDGKIYADDAPGLQAALAAIYNTDKRPHCLCRPEGVPMYVSRFTDFVIKRMPESGGTHAPDCDSFEIADADSGRGLHAGEAIQVLDDGQLRLRLGFTLTRYEGRSVPHAPPSGSAKDSVAAPRGALSIGALLHLLWNEAGFNKWSPRMAGKRHWGVIQYYLLQAAGAMEAKGGRLSDYLLVPEAFRSDKKQEILVRHNAQLAHLGKADAGVFPMLVLIGEVKQLEETSHGARVTIKHLPEIALEVAEDLLKGLRRHFGALIESVQTNEGGALIVACTIRQRAPGRYCMEAASLMLVNEQWIPVNNRFERAVADALIAANRSFIKVLRYGAPERFAYANFVLRDTGAATATLDIVLDKNVADTTAKEALVAQRPPGAWVWRTPQSLQMPPLPPKVDGTGQTPSEAPVACEKDAAGPERLTEPKAAAGSAIAEPSTRNTKPRRARDNGGSSGQGAAAARPPEATRP